MAPIEYESGSRQVTSIWTTSFVVIFPVVASVTLCIFVIGCACCAKRKKGNEKTTDAKTNKSEDVSKEKESGEADGPPHYFDLVLPNDPSKAAPAKQRYVTVGLKSVDNPAKPGAFMTVEPIPVVKEDSGPRFNILPRKKKEAISKNPYIRLVDEPTVKTNMPFQLKSGHDTLMDRKLLPGLSGFQQVDPSHGRAEASGWLKNDTKRRPHYLELTPGGPLAEKSRVGPPVMPASCYDKGVRQTSDQLITVRKTSTIEGGFLTPSPVAAGGRPSGSVKLPINRAYEYIISDPSIKHPRSGKRPKSSPAFVLDKKFIEPKTPPVTVIKPSPGALPSATFRKASPTPQAGRTGPIPSLPRQAGRSTPQSQPQQQLQPPSKMKSPQPKMPMKLPSPQPAKVKVRVEAKVVQSRLL